MRNSSRTALGFLMSTALATVLGAQAAWAQAGGQATDSTLEGVVVTATRQAESLNRVPLSVSAETQRSLDQQGIKNVADLQRTVPALAVSGGLSSGISNFSIRGILATTGAPTTGVYLDDVPLQKRFSLNAAQANGTPAPPLFDLERVEVLRGPQVTLYGGSSQGGTIRFITPEPSLTDMQVYARAEGSLIDHGSQSYEAGVAVGGPLVQDKLGFRASVFGRHNGGWIDIRDPYAAGSPVRFKDANDSEVYAFRGAVAWQPTAATRLTLSGYYSKTEDSGWSDASTLDAPQFGTRALCFNGTNTPVSCSTPGAFVRQPQTYGPYEMGRYDSLSQRASPYWTKLGVISATLDQQMGDFDLKVISSYLQDRSKGSSASEAVTNSALVKWPAGYDPADLFNLGRGVGLFRPAPELATILFKNDNKRKGLIEEIRLSSSPDARPISFVAGVYYSHINSSSYTTHGAAGNNTHEDCDRYSQLMFGLDCSGAFEPDPFPNGSMQERIQNLRDIEIAGYGDVTWHIGERLRLIGGLRVSRVMFDYYQANAGTTPGHLVPTEDNGGIIQGSVAESPVSPKVSAQYQITPDNMVYVTAAKGYRAGGVNPPITQSICGAGLALVGLTEKDIPRTYDSDTVWSYEAGAKVRLLDRVQVNASVYNIDWSQMQFAVTVPSCGPSFIQNIGKARSRGFDLQAQGRLLPGLTANLAVGYTNAEYIETAFGPKPLVGAATPVVQKGDKLPVPPWQVSVGLQYDFSVAADTDAYVRGDYQYAGAYWRGLAPGVASYNPETRRAASTGQVNIRAGVNRGPWNLNLFVINLFEAHDVLARGGGISGCAIAQQPACPRPTSFNPLRTETYQQPRQIGLQLVYRR